MQNQTWYTQYLVGLSIIFWKNLSQSRLSSWVNWFGNLKPSSKFRCSGCHVIGCLSAVAGKEENCVAHKASKGQPYVWGSYWSKVKVNVACKQQLETPSSCFYCLLNGQVNCQDVVFPTQSCDVKENGKQECFSQLSVYLYFTQYNSAAWKLVLILICALVAYFDCLKQSLYDNLLCAEPV